jgi:hypothetical protein
MLSLGWMITFAFSFCFIIWMKTIFLKKNPALKEYSKLPAIVPTVLSWLSCPAAMSFLSCSGHSVQSYLSTVQYTDLFRLICQANLSRLACLDCPVLDLLSWLYRHCCLGCSILSCSGYPVISFLPLLSFPAVLSQMSCPSCPISTLLSPALLSLLSCPCCHFLLFCLCICPVPAILSGCPVVAVMFWSFLPLCSVQTDLSKLTYPNCPVPLSCPGWLVLVFLLRFSHLCLSRLSYPSCSVFTIMFWPSYPPCPVRLICPG